MSRFTFLGRIVQGDVHKAQPQRKDDRTGALKFRKDGTPDCPFYVALAIPKNSGQRFHIDGVATYESQKAIVDADARAAWPDFFKGNAARPQGLQFPPQLHPDCTNPKFANKIIDGDGFDDKGRANSENEGWAGCWVVKFSNGFAPTVSEWVSNWTNPRGQTVTDWVSTDQTGRVVKCGDYVTISGECASNKSSDSPGMYMNFDTVGFEKEGDPIVQRSAVDTGAALGRRDGGQSNPNGGNANVASTSGHAHGQTNSETAPAYDGYRQTDSAAPPPPGDDAPPPPPAGPRMTAKAATSYEKYKAAGWTDAQLIANGFMEAA